MRWMVAVQLLTEIVGGGSKMSVYPPRIRTNSSAGCGDVADATLTTTHKKDRPVMTFLSFNDLGNNLGLMDRRCLERGNQVLWDDSQYSVCCFFFSCCPPLRGITRSGWLFIQRV